ncbi:RipA family octameric membrane protein [Microbacterium saperdae]|uniref:RipA family octameric membrane protein n=1 Tax=Microbacterium saperdae TaxID=69368 RepID=UPI00114E57AD|nr:hypothetical protein [Microbacterium saperdae]
MDHAWSWFALHADQRIRTMNMYFVLFALLTAGYGTFVGLKSYWIAAALAGVGAIASIAFLLLKERNRTLVKLAERPLRELQAMLADTCSIPIRRTAGGEWQSTRGSFALSPLRASS